MFTQVMLTRYASAEDLRQGYALFQEGAVVSMEYEAQEDNHDIIRINANVEDIEIWGRRPLSVRIAVDEATDELYGYDCRCYRSYGARGICVHAVAALYQYIAYRDSHPEERLRGKTVRARRTEHYMAQLLYRYGQNNVMSDIVQDTVDLVPRITAENGTFLVEFTVGREKKYVVRSISSLLSAVRSNKQVKYGKNLNFIHKMNVFTEMGQKYLLYLMNIEKEYSQLYRFSDEYRHTYGYNRNYFETGLSLPRSIPLEGRLLDDFFNIRGTGTYIYLVPSGNRPLEEEYTLADGEENFNVKLSQVKGGVELSMEGADLVRGSQYFYTVNREKHRIYRSPAKDYEKALPFLEYMDQQHDETPFISERELTIFARDVLPGLEGKVDLDAGKLDLSIYLPEKAAYEFYLDIPQEDMISCKPVAVYGEKRYDMLGVKTVIDARNLAEEQKVISIIGPFFTSFNAENNSYTLHGSETQVLSLMTDGVRKMQEFGNVFVSDALKKLDIRETPKVTFGVSVEHDLLRLNIASSNMSLEELAEVLSKYDKKKKYYKLKSGGFVSLADPEFEKLSDLKEMLQLTPSQIKSGKFSLPKFRALYLDGAGKGENGLSIARNKDFKALIRNMGTIEDSDYEIPGQLDGIMREYQKSGYRWLRTLKENGFSGILADDMGLGKTLQVLALLLSVTEQRKTLIVCPATLVYNWAAEIRRFTPEIHDVLVVGTQEERRKLIEGAGENDVLVTSYDLLKRDIAFYNKIPFYTEILDEAQYIKNASTQVAHAVKKIEAPFKLALTGTPIENRLSELWSIFDYLMPGFLFSYERFRKEFEIPIVSNEDHQASERLRRMISPFVLRRTKKNVLSDLPEKTEEVLDAKLEGEQKKLYDAHVQRLKLLLSDKSEEEFKKDKILVLSELTRLRQLCCNPGLVYEDYQGNSSKEELCMDVVRNAIDSGHKLLLFSQFTTMLDALTAHFKEEEIPFYLLTGATPKEKRAEMIEAFQRDETPVFCISLKAGGTGINLTAADIVIHFDPWWNSAVENQATDRVHRIGQKNSVTVYKLILQDTIEQRILELQEQKNGLADEILSGEAISAASLSKEQLMELLDIR